MGRQKSPGREKAFELFRESGGKISSAEIAEELGEKLSTVNTWKSKDKWKDRVGKVGAPFGNQNGVGNTGGPPLGSQNHYIHGFYSKLLPKQTYDIFKQVNEMDPLDMLWHSILLKFSAILRTQKIMYVKNKNDKTVEKVGYKKFDGELSGETWEVQQAWDKQAQFLKAQSDAMGQLSKMIRNYEELLHKDWDVATELQKTRVEVLKQKLKDPDLGKNKLEDFM